MPLSMEHEAPVELCREHPEIVPAILRDLLHLPVPPFSRVRVTDPGTRPVVATGQRADIAVILEDGERAVSAAILEPQRQVDIDKWYSWPRYLAELHCEVRCATYLVVIALSREVARWAATPIRTFQPGSPLTPYVIGPDDLPPLTTLEQASAEPLLAALTALLHAAEPSGPGEAVIAYQATGISGGPNQAEWLYKLLRAIMSPDRFERFQELMMLLHPEVDLPKGKYEWAKYNQGKAEAIVSVLTVRQVGLTEEQRQRILSEPSTEVLDRWLARAVTAATAEDIFAEP